MFGGCSVCSDDQGTEENPLVYCDGCELAVHQACYGIVQVPPGSWFCGRCEAGETQDKIKCELCPNGEGALKKTESGSWAHVVCALYIPEVAFGNNNTMEPIIIKFIKTDRYNKNCYLCQETDNPTKASYGAVMDCHKAGCKQSFHVTCAQSAGLLCEEAGQGSDNLIYCGYCKHHFRKLKAANRKPGNSTNSIGSSYLDTASDSSQDNDPRFKETASSLNRTEPLNHTSPVCNNNIRKIPSTSSTTSSTVTASSNLSNSSSPSLLSPNVSNNKTLSTRLEPPPSNSLIKKIDIQSTNRPNTHTSVGTSVIASPISLGAPLIGSPNLSSNRPEQQRTSFPPGSSLLSTVVPNNNEQYPGSLLGPVKSDSQVPVSLPLQVQTPLATFTGHTESSQSNPTISKPEPKPKASRSKKAPNVQTPSQQATTPKSGTKRPSKSKSNIPKTPILKTPDTPTTPSTPLGTETTDTSSKTPASSSASQPAKRKSKAATNDPSNSSPSPTKRVRSKKKKEPEITTVSTVDSSKINSNGSLDDPTRAFEELRDEVWSTLSRNILDQAQQFDIPSMFGLLYTIRRENEKLTNRVRDLRMQVDQMNAVTARLELPGPMLTQHLNITSPNFSSVVSSLAKPMVPGWSPTRAPIIASSSTGLITAVNPPYMSSVYTPMSSISQIGANSQNPYYARQ